VGKSLDQLFDDLFHDKTEEEKALLKKKYSNIETLSKADRRIELIARDIVKHFNQKIRTNGFKAQLVEIDRSQTIRSCHNSE
jgi:type I restriction enzyme R subunit